MFAAVMCGGRGSRMKLPFRGAGEKPLVEVCGKKLVDYVLDELTDLNVIAVTSPNTPETERYLKDSGVETIRAPGKGYVSDLLWFVREYNLTFPLLVLSSDLVFFENVLDFVIEKYVSSDCVALSCVSGGKNVGINVIDGYHSFFSDSTQPEMKLEVKGVFNVNTREDVAFVESALKSLALKSLKSTSTLKR